MSEFYKGKSLEDNSTEGQRALLLDIQEHLLDDKYSELMDRVNDIVASRGDSENFFESCDFVRPTASVEGKTSGGGAFFEVYSLTFIGTSVAGGGTQIKKYHVPVAEAIGDSALPINGFSDEEAELFAEHVNEIKYAKGQGLLPNLSADLSCINEPFTALTMTPPDPKRI